MSMSKESRKVYGLTGAPTEVVSAKLKPMKFDHDGRTDTQGRKTKKIETRSWCLTNGKGEIGFANSYDGGLGAKATVNWHPASEISAKKLSEYTDATPEDLAVNGKFLKVVAADESKVA